MSFRKLLGVLFVALGCSAAARAQLGIYGIYQGNELSGIQCLSTTVACSNGASAQTNGHIDPSGGFGGVFYDFKTFGPVRLGADLRAGVVRANKSASSPAGGTNLSTVDSVLGGIRASVRTPISWVKPYGQFSIGYARSDASEPRTATANQSPQVFDSFVQYQFFAGTDVRILPALDLRLLELGIGNMNRIGNGTGSSSIGVKSIGAGFVFHLP